MSDRPERVFAGLTSKNPTEYIREDTVQEMLKEQREACANAVFAFLPKASPEQVAYAFEVKESCLNAVEKA